jgi:Leucine-rich repeat (LRR) protein
VELSQNLTALNLSHNALSGALPEVVCQLENLKSLRISHNSITALPREFARLAALEELVGSFIAARGSK